MVIRPGGGMQTEIKKMKKMYFLNFLERGKKEEHSSPQ
jgi:hypothetical protein